MLASAVRPSSPPLSQLGANNNRRRSRVNMFRLRILFSRSGKPDGKTKTKSRRVVAHVFGCAEFSLSRFDT